jgi:hypothetical protein
MIWPSAGAFNTFCAAIEPLAPPKFSTITGCPMFFDKVLLTVRAITSDKPPAG